MKAAESAPTAAPARTAHVMVKRKSPFMRRLKKYKWLLAYYFHGYRRLSCLQPSSMWTAGLSTGC